MHNLSKAIVSLSISALAFTPQAALAAKWVLAGEDLQSEFKTYVDVTFIERRGTMIMYWARTDYVNHEKGWKSDMALVEANCTTSQIRYLQLSVYFKNGTNESNSARSEWRYAVPETVGKMELDFACSNM